MYHVRPVCRLRGFHARVCVPLRWRITPAGAVRRRIPIWWSRLIERVCDRLEG